MRKYLLVEGITDVSLVKYICQKRLRIKFPNSVKKSPIAKVNLVDIHQCEDFYIIDIKGQDNLLHALKTIIAPFLRGTERIGIIQDADNDFNASKVSIEKAITDSEIPRDKIQCFLTPNNKDIGDLETLLLSTIAKGNKIMSCFDDYKTCLQEQQTIHTKALNKGQVYAYTMYSQQGENLYKPQDSFIHKDIDTKLWDLDNKKFKPLIDFILSTF